ncbi:MAG: hypothetical protein AVDCRST_MAG01-01-902, partial [uncultured Rubrobacteraceae bacterium]
GSRIHNYRDRIAQHRPDSHDGNGAGTVVGRTRLGGFSHPSRCAGGGEV